MIMFVDLETTQAEWFQYFGSRVDVNTGEIIYEEPASDARVQIRSLMPFYEERLAKRKKSYEHVFNPKTRTMERVTYYLDQSPAEDKAEREDAWDYAIVAFEGFQDTKTGEKVACTRENKLKLMKLPVFDRFVARCLQLLNGSAVATEKN